MLRIFGVLRDYDLPDLVAAVLSRRPSTSLLVLDPVNEVLKGLGLEAARQQYALAANVAGNRLTIKMSGNGADVVETVATWMSGVQ